MDRQNKELLKIMTYLVEQNIEFESCGINIFITNCNQEQLKFIVNTYKKVFISGAHLMLVCE